MSRFDRIAHVYNEAVPFFTTFAQRLVSWANPPDRARLLDHVEIATC
ncbi:hypothetical protein [Sciscionella marina]|nr:hypothetical protein [Sciscionella marina]